MCGFFASNAHEYFGIDPNTAVYNKYFEQAEYYNKILDSLSIKTKKYTLINLPAEDVEIPQNYFDIVFTSPPYFNREWYSEQENQSYKRYPQIDLWLNNFLLKVIKKCWDSLNINGYLMINISDICSDESIKGNENRYRICDTMNDFIKSLGGKNFECIGMEMTKRVNSFQLKDKNGINVEPIWCWTKTENTPKISDLLNNNLEDW